MYPLHFQPFLERATAVVLPLALHLVVGYGGLVLALGKARQCHWWTSIFLLVSALVALLGSGYWKIGLFFKWFVLSANLPEEAMAARQARDNTCLRAILAWWGRSWN